jgi:hypothetical protein
MSEKILKQKGAAILIAAVVLAVVVGITGVIYANFIFRIQSTLEMVREQYIIEAINAMENVKISLQDSIEYAVYDASRDVLANGGFCDRSDLENCEEKCKVASFVPTYQCKPYWRIYEDIYAPESEGTERSLLTYMKNRTLQIFNSRASLWRPIAPAYCLLSVGKIHMSRLTGPDEGFYVMLSSFDPVTNEENKMSYSSNFFTVSDHSSFKESVKVNTMGILEVARQKFIDSDIISDTFTQSSQEMFNSPSTGGWLNCTEVPAGSCSDASTDYCDKLLKGNCSATVTPDLAYMDLDHDGLINETEIYIAFVKNKMSNIDLGSEMVAHITDLGCVNGKYDIEIVDNGGDCTCKYTYYGSGAFGVEVVDTASKYPIGSSFTELSLKFNAASGNIEPSLRCPAPRTDDDPSTPDVEFPEWQYCKVPVS